MGLHHIIIPTLGGAGLSGLLASAGYKNLPKKTKKKISKKRHIITNSVLGGALGAYWGGRAHFDDKLEKEFSHHFKNRSYKGRSYKSTAGSAEDLRHGEARPAKKSPLLEPQVPIYNNFKNSATKAEAKGKYKNLAMQHHPDKKGDPDMFKNVQNAWDHFKDSSDYTKLAMRAHMMHPSVVAAMGKTIKRGHGLADATGNAALNAAIPHADKQLLGRAAKISILPFGEFVGGPMVLGHAVKQNWKHRLFPLISKML